jgi:hypothetical protein
MLREADPSPKTGLEPHPFEIKGVSMGTGAPSMDAEGKGGFTFRITVRHARGAAH